MIADRYPTPDTDDAFGRQTQIDHWLFITKAYAEIAAKDNNDYVSEKVIHRMAAPTREAVATREIATGHEVVAFLSLLEEKYPDVKRYLHLGLTSSDLVEYALNAGIEEHSLSVRRSLDALQASIRKMPDVKRLSRTHGQVGYLTNLHAEFGVTNEALQAVKVGLRLMPRVLKSPGPSGVYSPVQFRGFSVGADLDRAVVPSTQIVHRDHLLAWAALYLRLACTLENLALQVRLGARSDVGELAEGAERVGSSAMPHKRNPIASEKVCGLARVARGYFMTLAEGVALWESRDLSNSAAERVAVAGLAGVVEHMMATMIDVIDNLVVNENRMDDNIEHHMEWRTHAAQYALQIGAGFGPVEASQFVRDRVRITAQGRMDIDGTAAEFRKDRELVLRVLEAYSKVILSLP